MLMFMTLALSWDVVARTGQLSLAHGAFFGLGAYAVAIAHRTWTLPPLLGMLVAGFAVALVAFALGVVTLRLRGIYFAIATLAFAEVLRTVALQFPDLTGGTVGIAMPPLFGGDRLVSYYLIAAIFVLALATSLAVRWSRLHYAVTAIRANETVAQVMGIDVVRVKVALFVASATLAGLAGAFYMPFITHTDPSDAFDIGRSVAALVFPIFGGLYTSAGPVIGTVLMRSLEEYLRVTPPWKEGYQVFYGLVIVVAVLFMPRGLLGLVGDLRRQRFDRRWAWRFSR
jgi:branched-chain amino acid transport system permease protein